MFYVTLTKLIFKCFAEGGGGGGDCLGWGGGGINTLFKCIMFLLTPCFEISVRVTICHTAQIS